MLGKKPTKKAVAKTAKPKVIDKVLSDKEIVKNKFKSARAEKIKNCFCIFDKKDGIPIHSGLAKSESNAWKLAAHSVL